MGNAFCLYGNPNAVFVIKEYRCEEGRADGMKTIDIGKEQGKLEAYNT